MSQHQKKIIISTQLVEPITSHIMQMCFIYVSTK